MRVPFGILFFLISTHYSKIQQREGSCYEHLSVWRWGVGEPVRCTRAREWIPITPRRLKVFEWLPEPLLVAFLQRLFDTKTAELVITRHANAARDELKELADEFKALARTTSIPTPVMYRCFHYLDPTVPPVAEGSSQISMHWRGMGIGLSVVAGVIFFFIWIRSQIHG